jgi:hypothetical protein
VQRLEVLVAIMLARERRAPADAAANGCTALAAALATLPSRPLEMVADAVAALGFQLDVERPSGVARNLLSPPEVQQLPAPLQSGPATVTELPPLTAEFRWNARSYAEATAGSKLQPGADVPATPPTLAPDSPNIVPGELLRQERLTAKVYDDVQQAAPNRERVPMKITAPDGRVRPRPVPLWFITSRRRCALQYLSPIAPSLGYRW